MGSVTHKVLHMTHRPVLIAVVFISFATSGVTFMPPVEVTGFNDLPDAGEPVGARDEGVVEVGAVDLVHPEREL